MPSSATVLFSVLFPLVLHMYKIKKKWNLTQRSKQRPKRTGATVAIMCRSYSHHMTAYEFKEGLVSVGEAQKYLTNLRKRFIIFFLAPQYLRGKILQYSQYQKHCFELLQLAFMLFIWCLKDEFNKHFRIFCVSMRLRASKDRLLQIKTRGEGNRLTVKERRRSRKIKHL